MEISHKIRVRQLGPIPRLQRFWLLSNFPACHTFQGLSHNILMGIHFQVIDMVQITDGIEMQEHFTI